MGRHCYCPADPRSGSCCNKRTPLERESIRVASSCCFVRTGAVPSLALGYKMVNDEMSICTWMADSSILLNFLTCLIS